MGVRVIDFIKEDGSTLGIVFVVVLFDGDVAASE